MSDFTVKRTPAHDALLTKAYELLKERDGDMSKVRMREVVERAGLTSGAFYNVWPGGLPTFQQSLLEFALAAEHIAYLRQILAELGSVGPDIMPLSEVARRFGAEDSQHLRADAGFRVQVALWARHGSDLAIAEALKASYRELAGTYVQVYDKLLENYGREWRDPFDGPSFATLLTALAEGLALRSAVDPESVPPISRPGSRTSSEDWELFGLTTALLVNSTTRPRADNENGWAQIVRLDAASHPSGTEPPEEE